MARLGVTIDPTAHSTEQNDFELLPNMNSKLEIIASDQREEGNNLALNLTVSVQEPEQYQGRRFWMWIDYQHSDPERQARGQRDLSKLCRAIGHDGPLDDDEHLLYRSFYGQVEQQPAGVSKKTGKPFKASNRLKKYYYPDEGNIPEVGVLATQPTAARPAANDNRQTAANDNAPSAAAAGKKRPWG